MFGFLSKRKIPATEAERIALVKQLLRLRAQHSASAQGFLDAMGLKVEEFDDSMVMMSAEAGIMRVVEQYLSGIEHGATDEIMIPFLNQTHASLVSQVGEHLPIMPPPYTLLRYVQHFVRTTNRHGMPIEDSFIPVAIAAVYEFYGRRQKG